MGQICPNDLYGISEAVLTRPEMVSEGFRGVLEVSETVHSFRGVSEDSEPSVVSEGFQIGIRQKQQDQVT